MMIKKKTDTQETPFTGTKSEIRMGECIIEHITLEFITKVILLMDFVCILFEYCIIFCK